MNNRLLAKWISTDKAKVEKVWKQLCEYDYSPMFGETVQCGQKMFCVSCELDNDMIARVDRFMKTEWESYENIS